MYRRKIGGWAKHWDFILIDTLCLQVSFLLAYFYRFGSFAVYGSRSAYRTSGLVLIFLSIAVAVTLNTMHNVLRRGLWEEAKHTIVHCAMVFAAIVILLFSAKDSDHVSRIVMYVTVGLYAILSYVSRLIYKQILLNHMKAVKSKGLLLVGDEEGIEKALKAFEEHPEASIDVKGIVVLSRNSNEGNEENRKAEEINGIPIVADEANAGHYIRNKWIDEVYIAVDDSSLIPTTLISQCAEMAVTVHQQINSGNDIKGAQWFEKIAKQPVLTTSIKIPRPSSLLIKRMIDVVAGLFMSFAATVVLLFVTPIIKATSPGPVLLKLERIGMNGRRFNMYMIRTMYMDADMRLKDWQEKHPNEKLTLKTDPRFIGNENGKTGIGARLRSLSLDDLPKGFNIFLGSMSLIGTRAPSVDEWEKYEFRHRARLSCKPGLTGLWQASGRSKTMSFEEATALDTEYITNWSLGLDWRILFKTATLRR